MSKKSSNQLASFLKKYPAVAAVDLLMCDLNGILRGKRIPVSNLAKVYKEGAYLAESIWASDITGETVEATGLGLVTGDGDGKCRPVDQSLVICPWQQDTIAQLQLTMVDADDIPCPIEPRNILHQLIKQLASKKLYPTVAIELEFYLLPETISKQSRMPIEPVTSDTQVYSIDDLDEHQTFLSTLADGASAQNIPISGAVAEYAPGQFEVNLMHQSDPLLACDHAVALKRLIKALAKQFDLQATFMAKPFMEYAGSGTHIHTSLYDDNNKNVFVTKNNANSKTLLYALNGLLELMPDAMLLFAPGANSFRRFVKDSYVPNAANWGINNRTVALRVPLSEPQAKRIEHRVAGADCNPYLLTAVVLASILLGLEKKVKPPAALSGDAYKQQPQTPLATNWNDAIESFAASQALPHYFGQQFCHVYAELKRAELEKFNRLITPTEFAWYL